MILNEEALQHSSDELQSGRGEKDQSTKWTRVQVHPNRLARIIILP
jgi:hypothetical protein